MSTLTASMAPVMHRIGTGGLTRTLIRRTVRLTGDEGPAFTALNAVIEDADVKRDGIVVTSFDVALNKFYESYSATSPFELLVDVATALEGVLIGGEGDGEGLTLRLCNRAATLLARDDDPGHVIFEDVKQLYHLRSKLVHGGQITERSLRTILKKVSSVPDEDAEYRFGVAVAYAVDRMRDLVRRAILARLCLAEKPKPGQPAGDAVELPKPRWPFSDGTSVDAILAGEAQRQAWRVHWHDRLGDLGAASAAAPASPAVNSISPED